MKCTLTIVIMIHIINCQQSEFERYFTDWIVNPGTLDEQKHSLHICFSVKQTA